MKNKGFSLVELIVVMAILSLIAAYGYSTFSSVRLNAKAKFDSQYLLQIPILLEKFFAENFTYPDKLEQIINSNNGRFSTPNEYYHITYRLSTTNQYTLSATLNELTNHFGSIDCYFLQVDENGKLTAFDKSGKDITDKCWKN